MLMLNNPEFFDAVSSLASDERILFHKVGCEYNQYSLSIVTVGVTTAVGCFDNTDHLVLMFKTDESGLNKFEDWLHSMGITRVSYRKVGII